MTTCQTPSFMPDPPDSGLTLIELILAVALLALLTAMLAGALRSGRNVLDRADDLEVEASIGAVRVVLRQLLSQAQPISNQREQQAALVGGPRSVLVHSNYAPGGQFDGIYRYELRLEPSSTSDVEFDLILTQSLYRPLTIVSAGAPQQSTRHKLLSSARSLQLRYFGRITPSDAAAWFSEWHAVALPHLIALDLEFAAEARRTWPPLIVDLALAQ